MVGVRIVQDCDGLGRKAETVLPLFSSTSLLCFPALASPEQKAAYLLKWSGNFFLLWKRMGRRLNLFSFVI